MRIHSTANVTECSYQCTIYKATSSLKWQYRGFQSPGDNNRGVQTSGDTNTCTVQLNVECAQALISMATQCTLHKATSHIVTIPGVSVPGRQDNRGVQTSGDNWHLESTTEYNIYHNDGINSNKQNKNNTSHYKYNIQVKYIALK